MPSGPETRSRKTRTYQIGVTTKTRNHLAVPRAARQGIDLQGLGLAAKRRFAHVLRLGLRRQRHRSQQNSRDKEIPLLFLAQGLEPGGGVNGIAKVHDLPFIVADFASDDLAQKATNGKNRPEGVVHEFQRECLVLNRTTNLRRSDQEGLPLAGISARG